MNPTLKKIIATALATGGIVSGSFAAANKLNCDHTLVISGKDYCVSEPVYREIQSNLRANAGFGGVRFQGPPAVTHEPFPCEVESCKR